MVFQIFEKKNDFLATCWSTHTISEVEKREIIPPNA